MLLFLKVFFTECIAEMGDKTGQRIYPGMAD